LNTDSGSGSNGNKLILSDLFITQYDSDTDDSFSYLDAHKGTTTTTATTTTTTATTTTATTTTTTAATTTATANTTTTTTTTKIKPNSRSL